MDTAAIPLPPSCPLLQLGTAAAAEKPPPKSDGIYVAEPRCDAEISMQIFCPLFPVLMTFGHQKTQGNKTVPEPASKAKRV